MKKQILSQAQRFPPLPPAQNSSVFEASCSLKTANLQVDVK